MGPINALESTGSMLVSGDQAIIATWTPHLSKMTATLINLGTETGKAAAMKLVGNLFLVGMTGALSDALLLAKATGASSEDVANLFNGWNPAAMLPARLKKITSKSYDQPTWELNMARKDVRLMLEEAEKTNTTLSIMPGIATIMDSYIAQGHGHDDWTVIAKDSI
jgi:3-hydroxyisobutyrate dehydrogenase